MDKQLKPNWIRSAGYDLLFILSPPFICLLLIFSFPSLFRADELHSEWLWFFLIVVIDVGHVYSTIYRTYFDKNTINKNKTLFYLSPLLIYIIGVVLHSINPIFFWRAMAYLAVFHFIRQQYGFLRLYTRNEENNFYKKIDSIIIYASTLYPILVWHLKGKQLFDWFIENDFIYINFPEAIPFLSVLYIALLVLYLLKEIIVCIKLGKINLPKNILIAGTALSWYFGIVYFEGDITFTLLNVVSHGIPYYSLVWAYGNKKSGDNTTDIQWLKRVFKPVNLLLFIGVLLILAYAEEMLWDGLVWKEHLTIFPFSSFFPNIIDSKIFMSLLIPLLSLPQLVHYFIDGFIWKLKNDTFEWSAFLR